MLAAIFAISGAVEIYDGSNFDSTVSTGVHFVDFFAPWCGHCRQLEPTWEALAATFAEDSSISIAKVDATAEASLASRMSIGSFPTLLLFADGGKKYKYEGRRSADELEAFARGGYKIKTSEWYASKTMYLPIEVLIRFGQKAEAAINYCVAVGSVQCLTIVGGCLMGFIVLLLGGMLLYVCLFDKKEDAPADRRLKDPAAKSKTSSKKPAKLD